MELNVSSITTRIVLPGRPLAKKDRAQRGTLGAVVETVSGDPYQNHEAECLCHAREQIALAGAVTYKVPIRAIFLYFLPDQTGWPELVWLLHSTSEILEKARLIENYRLICSYDGSRIAGIDKENPRTEITVISF